MLGVPSATIAFLVLSLFGACLALGMGIAAGAWFFGIGLASKETGGECDDAARQEEEAKRLAEQAAMAASRLSDTAQIMAGDVVDHSARMQAISAELATADCQSGDGGQMVFTAVSQILLATAQLQQRLDKAEKQIAAQVLEIQAHITEARTDSLTGLANRRVFEDEVKRRLSEWQRYGRPFAIVLSDIDSFKRINDTHGHQVGDDVLRNVGKILKANSRDMDIPCRYGGEEFAVIVPATEAAGACAVAERLRQAVEQAETVCQGSTFKITCSVGVSNVKQDDNPWYLIRRADEALYASKQSGCNRGHWHNGAACVPLPIGEHGSDGRPDGPLQAMTPPAVLEVLESCIHESNNYGTPLTVMQLQVEDLDVVRQKYGSAIARQMLNAADLALQKALREPESLGRLEDGKFLVMLPGKTRSEADKVAKSMRKLTKTCILPLTEEQLHLRLRHAVASLAANETGEQLLARLKEALTAPHEQRLPTSAIGREVTEDVSSWSAAP